MAVAVPALALSQQVICLSDPKIRAKPRPWFPQRTTLLNSQKKAHIFIVSCSSSQTSQPPEADVQTPESCVNLGLSLFSKGRVKDALVQFEMALSLDPNPVEAQAALYNKACCHAYIGEAKKAADCLRTALRDYNLKFGTILNDPDLAFLRASPEFKELQEEARLGGEDIGYSFRRDLKLISEVQAPFRGIRRFFYVAFSAAAGISLFFTVPRLIRAIKGGDGAPDVWETVGNASINVGGIIVLVALFFWDNKKEEEQLEQISRNETLSRLPLRLSTNRIVELVQLRDTVRPVILAGKKESVSSAIQKAERFRTELLKRGVLLVPVIWGEGRAPQVEKKGFGVSVKAAAAALPSIVEDFEKRAESITAKSKLKAEIRFRAEVVSPEEWESSQKFDCFRTLITFPITSDMLKSSFGIFSSVSPFIYIYFPYIFFEDFYLLRWIRDQQEAEGVTPGEDVYIILRLDGLVRRSGKGMPDWSQIVQELPPMEALLSKLER